MSKEIKKQVQEFLDGKRSFIDASGENDHVVYWDEFLENSHKKDAKDCVARTISADKIAAAVGTGHNVYDDHGNLIGFQIDTMEYKQ